MPLPAVPCIDCEKREIGCHGKCEPYLEYNRQMRVICEKRKKANDANSVHSEFIAQNIKRYKKKLKQR